MKVIARIYSIIVRSFAICTLITLAMLFFAVILDIPNINVPSVTLARLLQILAISIPLSLAHELFSLRRLPFTARLAIHYVSVTACFTALFAVVGNIGDRPFAVFIWIFVFTIAYSVVAAIVLPILRATGYYARHLSRPIPGGEEKSQPYEKRFS